MIEVMEASAVVHTISTEETGSSHRRVYRAVCSCGEFRSPGWRSIYDARVAGRAHQNRVGYGG